MNDRDRNQAFSNGRKSQRADDYALLVKWRDAGYAAPLGVDYDPWEANFALDVGERAVRRAICADAWRQGQDKLRDDLDARLAEVAQ